MTHPLDPYPAYRDSGLPWLGEVPENWEVRRLKQICRIEYGDSLASEARQEGIVPVFGSNGRVGFHNVANTKSPCIIVGRKGSFGKINYSDVSVFAIDTAFFIDNRFSFYDIRWLYFLLEWLQLDDVTKDSAIPGLDREDAYQRLAPVPPIPEQTAIARYLDHACERIDGYVDAKERLIALLKERRQTIIDRAATRGLDPNAPMKPTGMDWMPEVPAHWEIRRLRNVADMRVSNVDKHAREGEEPVRLCNYVDVYKNDYIDDRMKFMKATATVDELERFRLEEGDVLVTKDSEAWDDIGVAALVTESASDLVSGYHLALLRPRASTVLGSYLLRALQSASVAHQFHVVATGVTRYGLSHADIKSILLPLPPLSEQAAIVERLERSAVAIDTALDRARRQIDLLREYRERLINDVVTGKLDVREARVAAAPDADAPQGSGQAPSHRVEAGAPAIPWSQHDARLPP